MNKIIPIFILALMILPVVTAVETYPQSQDIFISKAIRINGAVDSSITANITVKRISDGEVLAASQGMTYNDSTQEHQYTISSALLDKLGNYEYVISATGSGLNETKPFPFTITPSGIEAGTNTNLVIILALFALVIVLSLSGFAVGRDQWLIKEGLFIGAFLVVLIILNVAANLAFGDNLQTLMTVALTIGIVCAVLFVAYILIFYTVNLVRAVKEVKSERNSQDLL